MAASTNASETLRRLGLRAAGGNHATLRRYARKWGISTEHFDAYASQRRGGVAARRGRPLEEMLIEHSPFARSTVKKRLLQEGIKQPVCELCGQGELWRGRRMSMILDHINGVADDHRLGNLQIVCPNCAATLDTHCGRQNRRERPCDRCGTLFMPNSAKQRHCSKACGLRWSPGHAPRPQTRKVPRPPYAQLVREVHALGWCGVGRRYGVSDNAVRKWVRQYERERVASGAVATEEAGTGETAAAEPTTSEAVITQEAASREAA